MSGQFTERLQSQDIIALMIKGLDAPPAPWFDALTNHITSDKDSEQYVWLGSAPTMREFTGGRKPATLNQNNFRVYNKEFESSLEIPVSWFERDHTGQIRMKIAELVERAREHKIKLLSALMDAGSSTLCYDGQYFFDTDHSEDASGTQSNILTDEAHNISDTDNPTAAEMETAIMMGIQQMMGFKDDKGEICNGSAKSFMVVVPVNMMKGLATCLKSEIIMDASVSRTANLRAVGSLMGITIDGVVNPRGANTTKFQIYRADAVMKPFIFQEERALTVSAVAEGSEHVFMNRTHLYGVDASYNVGLNQWRGALEVQFD